MINSEFSYSNLQTTPLPIVKDNALAVTFPDSNYIGLFQNPSDETTVDLTNRVGLVVYISLKETADNIERGWNLLVDIFFEFHVTFVLLPKREHHLTTAEEQGRQISIYHYLIPGASDAQKASDARSLAQRIATTLFQGGIETGDVPLNVTRISNSPHLFYQRDNMEEVTNQRQILEAQNPDLCKSENFFSPFARSSTFDIPPNVNLQDALKLVRSHQIFYEIDRRLPMKFSFKGVTDEEGQHIEFDGCVILAMKITNHALKTILVE